MLTSTTSGRPCRRRLRAAARALIVTDTVFSMDGDAAPLAEIVELKERYGAALLVDDAHGGGVFGPHGEGYAHEVGVADRVDLTVGTFSKAFGVYGAYVAGSTRWIEQLVNTARSLIYSTGLPPPTVDAIAASIDLVRGADSRRAALAAKGRAVSEAPRDARSRYRRLDDADRADRGRRERPRPRARLRAARARHPRGGHFGRRAFRPARHGCASR